MRTHGGTELVFRVDQRNYQIQIAAVVVLLFGALGGLATVIVPFYPELFQLIPVSVLLILLAWFMVVSRLRHRGPSEFMELVGELLADGEEAPAEPELGPITSR